MAVFFKGIVIDVFVFALEFPLPLSLKPVFHLRIFSREANFSFVFGLSTGTNWIKTK
jgi:hypothetical protein